MNKTNFSCLFLLASLPGLLAACAFPGAQPVPTPFPADYFPTVVVMTAQAAMATSLAGTPSATPTDTPAPTETPIPPTPTPTDTLTPSPAARMAQIQIHSPGPMSKVTSPFHLRMQMVAGESRLVQFDLQGEDGRVLYSKLERVPNNGDVYFSFKIPFEIRAAAEVGRLTVSTKDGQGRLQSLAAQRLLLLSVGTDEITPSGDLLERVVLYAPKANAAPAGGVLDVEGRFLPFNDQLVYLELIDAQGKTVGLRELDFIGSDEQIFSTTVPYKVSEPTQARLVLRQADDRMEGLVYLYSIEITLNP
ncbi:MAG: hypothetical protein ACOYYU_11685 [Chloroflexota bacterium]